jgi:hypothetical protein
MATKSIFTHSSTVFLTSRHYFRQNTPQFLQRVAHKNPRPAGAGQAANPTRRAFQTGRFWWSCPISMPHMSNAHRDPARGIRALGYKYRAVVRAPKPKIAKHLRRKGQTREETNWALEEKVGRPVLEAMFPVDHEANEKRIRYVARLARTRRRRRLAVMQQKRAAGKPDPYAAKIHDGNIMRASKL